MRSIKTFTKKTVYIFLFSLLLIGSSSWGFLMHRTINQIAIYNLPDPLQSFFYQDMQYLVENAPRPDTRRNTDKTEDKKHIIDIEEYGPNAINEMPLDWATAVKKYSLDTLEKHGYGPYNVIMQLDKLTNAFKSKNKDSILFYAADLGHYVSDMHVPLHLTNNYDGQLTGQKGMHSLWETFIPSLKLDQYQLYNPHKAKYISHPEQALWADMRSAYALLPEMFAKEIEVSKSFTPEQKYKTQMYFGKSTKMYTKEFAEVYAETLGATINRQLIASANMLSDFWYTAWVNAGKPNFTTRAISTNLEMELNSFRKNQLIQDTLLISKKQKAKE
jgi:hypothetical protein